LMAPLPVSTTLPAVSLISPAVSLTLSAAPSGFAEAVALRAEDDALRVRDEPPPLRDRELPPLLLLRVRDEDPVLLLRLRDELLLLREGPLPLLRDDAPFELPRPVDVFVRVDCDFPLDVRELDRAVLVWPLLGITAPPCASVPCPRP
jgi:hypothetical protein